MKKLLIGAIAASLVSTSASAITFVNALAVPNGIDLSGLPNGVNSNRFGGFGSDLIYDTGSNSFFGMSDRGPGGGLLSYSPRIQQFGLTIDSATGAVSGLTQIKAIVLKNPDGTPFNGLNPQLLNGSPGTLGNSFDPEGLARLPNGNFLVSDEYGPAVYEFKPDGTLARKFTTPSNLIPKGANGVDYVSGRPDITSGRQDNRGFEGITVSADGKTAYAIMQDPLVDEGNNADGRRSRNLRIVAFDVTSGEADKQYLYRLEDRDDINGRIPGTADDFSATNQGRSIGASAIVATPDGKLLVIERDNRGLGVDPSNALLPIGSKRVFQIDLAGATDISPGQPGASLTGSNDVPAGVVPVSKSLYVDVYQALTDAGVTVAEKMEGLSFGPRLDDGGISMFLITDNDFSVTQIDGSTQYDVCFGAGGVFSTVALDSGCPSNQSLIPTYVYSFRLSAAEASALGLTAVPEPANWAMMIAGFGMIGGALRGRRARNAIA